MGRAEGLTEGVGDEGEGAGAVEGEGIETGDELPKGGCTGRVWFSG